MASKDRRMAFFIPKDIRTQQMFIPAKQLPKGFFDRPQDFEKFLFVAELPENWSETFQYGMGNLIKNLGRIEDINVQTEGILLSHNIDFREYTEKSVESIQTFMGKRNRKKIFAKVCFILLLYKEQK